MLMYKNAPPNDPPKGDENFEIIVKDWNSECDSSANKAILSFHFAVPTLLLILVLLLDQWMLSIGLYLVLIIYGHFGYRMYKEKS